MSMNKVLMIALVVCGLGAAAPALAGDQFVLHMANTNSSYKGFFGAKYFDGTPGNYILSGIATYDALESWAGGYVALMGNIDADDATEVLLWDINNIAAATDCFVQELVEDGTTLGNGEPGYVLAGGIPPYPSSDKCGDWVAGRGMQAMLGDLDGDGIDSLILYHDGSAPAGTPGHWYTQEFVAEDPDGPTGDGGDNSGLILSNFVDLGFWVVGGYKGLVADTDSDGIDELLIRRGTDGAVFMKKVVNTNGLELATEQTDLGDWAGSYIPLAGDWDDDGDDEYLLYKQSDSNLYATEFIFTNEVWVLDVDSASGGSGSFENLGKWAASGVVGYEPLMGPLNYGDLVLTPEILSITPQTGDILKLVVNLPSPAGRYHPESVASLATGSWTNEPHSDDGVNAFVNTNMGYSTLDATGTNEVIYVRSTPEIEKFIKIIGE